jgi:Flp pilus assembly protein TadG
MARLIKRLKDSSGATMLEAALITPLLLLLTFSIVDFASMFYVYLSLESGVSQATRYGVTGALMDDPSKPAGTKLSREASLKAAMRAATPTLTIPDEAFSFSHMRPGTASFVNGVGGPGDVERLTVDYDWALLTPLLRPFFTNGTLHIRVQSTMKNEARFQ